MIEFPCDVPSWLIVTPAHISSSHRTYFLHLRSDLSACATTTLEDQLDQCQQLHELEPENKCESPLHNMHILCRYNFLNMDMSLYIRPAYTNIYVCIETVLSMAACLIFLIT